MTIVDDIAEPLPRAVIDLAALRHNVAHLAAARSLPPRTMLAVKADAYGHGLLPDRRGRARRRGDLARRARDPGRARPAPTPASPFRSSPGCTARTPTGAPASRPTSSSASRRVWQLEAIAARRRRPPGRRPPQGRHRAQPQRRHPRGLARAWSTRPSTLQERGRRAHPRRVVAPGRRLHRRRRGRARGVPARRSPIAEARGARFEILHLAASSAGIRMPEARFDLVRFGIAAYGISPFDDTTGADLGLVPVMRLEAPVTEVHVGGTHAGPARHRLRRRRPDARHREGVRARSTGAAAPVDRGRTSTACWSMRQRPRRGRRHRRRSSARDATASRPPRSRRTGPRRSRDEMVTGVAAARPARLRATDAA